jgi:DNA modification methylase
MDKQIELRLGDSLEVMKEIPDNSIDCIVTSPPYFNLRDYGEVGQIGNESTVEEYINNLSLVFKECYRILRKSGSFWLNIADVYCNRELLCIPDKIKLELVKIGFICRNEIIWHKPNAMPSSAKNRFNNDYEKFYFFTKSKDYYFETQYEPMKTVQPPKKQGKKGESKYLSIEQESSVRQGMNRSRGTKIIEVRNNLPEQETFVSFIRKQTTIQQICESCDIPKTKVEHWFRRDKGGFAYPSVEDWNKIKFLLDDFSDEFYNIDLGITTIDYETDDINKNADKGRIKRAVWSINTKGFKGCHFAPYPESLVEIPIKACTKENDIVLDPFMGSGTTGVVSKKT